MRIEVWWTRDAAGDVDGDYARRRLSFALGRFAGRVRRVRLRMSDENGPKGGLDRRCRIEVRLAGAPEVRVEDVASDPREALDGAAERASWAVARALDRARDFERTRG